MKEKKEETTNFSFRNKFSLKIKLKNIIHNLFIETRID